jgi:protein-disulfide isomerase
MAKAFKGQPKLVVLTLITLTLAFFLASSFYKEELPKAISIDTSGLPTIGNSYCKVQIVVFEEPQCSACRKFNEVVFPEIEKNFINTGKVKYTVVPVAFIQGSKLAAESMYCVYHQDKQYPNPELFLRYLDTIYSNNEEGKEDLSSKEALIMMAKSASSAIDIEKLNDCLESQEERVNIIKNTKLAKKTMDDALSTPRVYVNGIRSKSNEYKDIKELVELCYKLRDQL